jgi:hypothetical protein
VYVDGFNLYYGCLKGTSCKWLDLGALCALLLPACEIRRIRYFTARISGRPDKPGSPTRQDAYLRALATRPKVSIHYGKFLQSTVRMPLAAPVPSGPKAVEVIRTEEKGSDVNLATYLLLDAFRNDSDIAVVVSNDSDLCEPIRIVQDEFEVPVGLLIPHARPSQALRSLKPAFVKQIRRGPLSASQFPAKGHRLPRPGDQQAACLVMTGEIARPRPRTGPAPTPRSGWGSRSIINAGSRTVNSEKELPVQTGQPCSRAAAHPSRFLTTSSTMSPLGPRPDAQGADGCGAAVRERERKQL